MPNEMETIETDIEEVEKNCKEVKCGPIKRTILSVIQLVKDIFTYLILCKTKKND